MKRMVLALSVMVAAAPASAQTIRPQDAIAHIGETATVEGRAHIQKMPSGEIYLDLAGRGDDAPISGYVSRWNAAQFPDIASLDGKRVAITGMIGSFRYRPEIFLTDLGQISAKQESGREEGLARYFKVSRPPSRSMADRARGYFFGRNSIR